jgi:hypothetical protein
MTARPARLCAIFAILSMGCPIRVRITGYQVDGEIHVAPSALGRMTFPAVLCAGADRPESLERGLPVIDGVSNKAILFCSIAKDEGIFPLQEWIGHGSYGSLPKRGYVYAWLQPVPGAAQLCAAQNSATAKVTLKDLDILTLPTANLPPEQRAPIDWPCGAGPQKGMPLVHRRRDALQHSPV